MNDEELGEALLGLDPAGLADTRPERITEAVLRRDRRSVRLLTALTIILWTLAALGIVVVLNIFLWLAPKQAQLMRDVSRDRIAVADRERIEHLHFLIFEKATVMVAVSVAALTLAALGTVILVFASRRATLRQVSASLAEISEQLKRLQKPGPP